jgi:hypothetical protein
MHVTDFTLSPRTPAAQTTSEVKEWHEFPLNSIELADTSECLEQIPDIKVTVNSFNENFLQTHFTPEKG